MIISNKQGRVFSKHNLYIGFYLFNIFIYFKIIKLT